MIYTPEQQADIAKAFKELKPETQEKFPLCPNCSTKFSSPPMGVCHRCNDIGHIPDSDTAMAILDELGTGWSIETAARGYRVNIYYVKGKSATELGTSPLHALLLAVKELEG